ncbi:MAG: inositol oxygenase [Chthonomonadales bacterium]|nr:inositol oxygenase [Chthonomonadales bacterium]
MEPNETSAHSEPVALIEAWEESLRQRYPPPGPASDRPRRAFRDYEAGARPVVRAFYLENHARQTLETVLDRKREFLRLNRRRMTVWQAMEYLNTLVDDSDPDTDLSQIEHLMQTAEAIRRDGQPRWFVLAGLIHDLGKVLCLFGEPQWAVVGDTFPVGCAFSERIVHHAFFDANPDSRRPEYSTPCGIYREGCGLDAVHLSWGHDEYLYQVVRGRLPDPALYMIRYHSFYPWHREGAYTHLTNEQDRKMLAWVRAFNPYDLYSKGESRPNVEALRPYYDDLIAEFLPGELAW